MLVDTTKLLSGLTDYAAVVVREGEPARVRSVQLVGLAPRVVLAVVVFAAPVANAASSRSSTPPRTQGRPPERVSGEEQHKPRFHWDFRTSVSQDPCLTTSPRHRGGAIRADAESCRRTDDRSTEVDRQEWRTQARRVAGTVTP